MAFDLIAGITSATSSTEFSGGAVEVHHCELTIVMLL